MLAYESAADATSGLKEVAKTEAGSTAGIVRYPVIAADKVLVAGAGLSLLAPPASGTFRPAWSAVGSDVHLASLQVVGDTIVALRRQSDTTGVVVTGVNIADGSVRFETLLGQSLKTVVLAEDRASIAVETASGATVNIALADLTGNKIASLAGAPAAPAKVAKPGATRKLPWRDGQIVVGPAGTVSYVDRTTGALKAEPFQLRFKPGQRLDGCRVAAVGDKGTLLAIADGQNGLSLIELAGDGGQQLVERARVELKSPPISELAVGDGVVGFVDLRGQLLTFTVPDLNPGPPIDLGAGDILGGPARAGDFVLLATDRGQLIGLDRSLGPAWKTPLAHGLPAGDLATSGTDAILAFRSGWLSRIDAGTGREVAAVDLGQAIALGPIVVGGEAIVSMADGALLKVVLPAKGDAEP